MLADQSSEGERAPGVLDGLVSVPDSTRPIVLVGMMGAGKTSAGTIVAKRLGLPFVDNDREMTHRTGRLPEDLLRSDAVEFRELEARLISETLASGRPVVLSVGGGAVERESTRQLLSDSATVVWLRGSVEVLLAHVTSDDRQRSQRPMLDGDPEQRMKELLERRTPLYESLADVVVDVDQLDIDATASEIVEALS